MFTPASIKNTKIQIKLEIKLPLIALKQNSKNPSKRDVYQTFNGAIIIFTRIHTCTNII